MQEAINIATPNLVNICIDSTDGIEKNGRMYCFYQEEPVYFRNSHELMRMMGALMDGLNYPQSSVELRTYSEMKQYSGNSKKYLRTPDMEICQKILGQRGQLDTIAVYVQYRQSATWQGVVYHLTDASREEFYSELEFLKIIDQAGMNNSL